jgi:hypothetical protein
VPVAAVDLDGLFTERENSQTRNPKDKVTNQLQSCLNTQQQQAYKKRKRRLCVFRLLVAALFCLAHKKQVLIARL